jgi:hypothetical protein
MLAMVNRIIQDLDGGCPNPSPNPPAAPLSYGLSEIKIGATGLLARKYPDQLSQMMSITLCVTASTPPRPFCSAAIL